MDSVSPEVLVILEEDADDGLRARIEREFSVVQSMLPRLLVLRAPAHVRVAALVALPGVQTVLAGPLVSLEAIGPLNESESIFVGAWLARQCEEKGLRPGEGEAWDDPGRLPPDPPKR